LNKRKIRGIVKYLVQWKRFIVEHDTWEREENLENTKEVVAKFEKKMSVEVRSQEKLKIAENEDFRRGELLGKYIIKMLYRWDNKNFGKKYIRKLERNWQKWKSVSSEEKP